MFKLLDDLNEFLSSIIEVIFSGLAILVALIFSPFAFLLMFIVKQLPEPPEPKPSKKNRPNKEEYAQMLYSERWTKTRSEILKRDKNQCQMCDSINELNVHHTRYEGYHPSDTSDSYLITSVMNI